MTVDVYIAYAQQDTAWMERLRNQLSAAERIGLIDAWHDGEIEIGADKAQAAREAMEAAEVVVLLLSADFFASEHLYEKEMGQALQLSEAGKTTVIPVLLRDCTWQLTPLANLQILPKNAKPVTDNHWQNPDQALKQIVDEIIRVSTAIRSGEDPKVTYTKDSEQVTTPEKTITKTIEKRTSDSSESTSLMKLVLYAIAGLGGFALVSFLINQAFTTPPTDTGTSAKVDIQEHSSTENNTTSEVLTTDEETSSRPTPSFSTLSLGGLEWSAKDMNIESTESWPAKNTSDGRLYTLKAARQLCPKGWRLPTRNDWNALSSEEISQLQLTQSGFYHKAYLQSGQIGYYLTSENTAGDQVWVAEFRGNDRALKVDRRYAHWGMSCRCVR